MSDLILATSSPRRQQMFKDLGVTYTIAPPEVDETVQPHEKANAYVQRIARDKAQKVAELHPAKIILSADTTVSSDGHIFGKPENADEALQMLQQMQNTTHEVLSAVCVVDKAGALHECMTTTNVCFRALTMREMEHFVAQEDNWSGKAGGYGLQTSAGSALITSIEGSHTGVIGLPLAETVVLLRSAGFDV